MARRRTSSGRSRRSKAAPIGRRVHTTQAAYALLASAGSTSRLKLRARQHAAIAALGERALAGLAPASLMDTAVRALAEVLEVELVQILELWQGDAMLAMRAGIGWKPGVVGSYRLATVADAHACYTLQAERPVIVADMARDPRFGIPELLQQHSVVSAMSAVIRSRAGPLGIIGVCSARRRRFSEDDASVLASAANILGMAIDRDRADTQLRTSERRLRAFFDHSPSLLNLRAADGRYLMINRRYRELFGVAPKQILGKSSTDLYPGDYGTRSQEAVMRVVRSRRPLVYEEETPTLSGPRHFVTTRFPIIGPDGATAAVGTVALEVTALREAETELRHYRDLLEGVTDTIPVALAYVSADGIYRWINRRGAERHGRPREAIVGMSMRALWGEAYWSQVLEPYTRRALAGETVSYERTLATRDGSQVQLEIHLTPSFGPDAAVEGFCVLAIDVTERQRAREALQAAYDDLEVRVTERTSQLAAAHRQAETLSYSIAHDLRAPLRAISGYARILTHDLAGEMPAQAADLLDRIGVNAERMGTLIDALLGFGQLSRQPLQPALIRLDDVVEDALGWMQNEIDGRRVEVERRELGDVRADPALIRIAVANLLSNAIKFSRGRDPARIEIGRMPDEVESIYYVRDNGAGFDMRYADKLFGMFQRLHGHGRFEGSGVGLASVQQIVNRHGGRIWAESVEGAGATFYFTLGPQSA
jgi:PAS domain S-box-containing protein